MSSEDDFWSDFWADMAGRNTDFQATGRGSMDVVGFLYTVNEAARILDLKPEDTLLDIGCGTGIVPLALAPFVTRIEALDFNPVMVERATENLSDAPNCRVTHASITETGQPDAAFDKVLAYSVLQYLTDDELNQALREVARVLKPGGRALFAASPDPARREALVSLMREKESPESFKKNMVTIDRLNWADGDALIRMAADAGLAGRIEPIHERIWQRFYMFDLVVTKNG